MVNRRFVLLLILTTAMGGEFARGAEEPAQGDPRTVARQAQMLAVFDDVTLQFTKTPERTLKRSPQPVLKYTNPVNSSQVYASMFLWFDGTIPVAVVCPSFRDSGNIYWEWTSLSSQPLLLKRAEQTVWQPAAAGHTPQLLPEAPIPAETPAARLTQMRALARRFNVTEERRGSTQEARLLPQPLSRWEHKDHGLVDAAMFSFSETTDPQLLLILEARRTIDRTERQWYYTLARMSSSPCTVMLDEQTVWTTQGYWKNPRSLQDPYLEAAIGQFDPQEFFR